MISIFNYIDRDSVIHRMTGASKLACLLLWTFAAMVSFNTPFLIVLSLLALLLYPLSKIRLKDVRTVLILLLTFMVVNNILIYLFSPEHGCTLYNSRTVLFTIYGPYTVTSQQLLYQANVILKYLATIPLIVVFTSTTNPSELAASLNKIGVSYKIAYSVALTLRYIPDLVNEYQDVARCQQARGIEMTKKENLFKRIKAAAQIVMPLILSSVDRIDTITNAMELRKFGTMDRRTWIMSNKFKTADIIAMAMGIGFVIYSFVFIAVNNGRYWNPFI